MTSVLCVALLTLGAAAAQRPPQFPVPPPVQKPAEQPKETRPPVTPPAAPAPGTPATAPGTVTPPLPAGESLPAAQPHEYEVGRDDVLQVTVIGEPDMSRQYRVNADGKFEFPYAGAVQAGGLTLRAIEQQLVKVLSDYIRSPQVTVEVATYRSQRVYVQGEVRSPGPITLEGPTSLLEILSRAGWNPSTSGDEIQLIHPRAAGSGPLLPMAAAADADIHRVSVADLQNGKLLAVAIGDGDTVYVPKAPTFFIGGFVRTPGEYTIRPGMTVQQAIIAAGGLTERGAMNRIRVTREIGGKLKTDGIKPHEKIKPGDVIDVKQRFF